MNGLKSNLIKQGDIFLADLNPVRGHEQGGIRPVLVLQKTILNKNLSTVMVAPITKNLKAKGYLTTYFLSKTKLNLDFDSIALLYQIRTFDKTRLIKKITSITPEMFGEIKNQLGYLF